MAQTFDTDPTSNKFFYLTGLSEIFGGGKNTFVINVTPLVMTGSAFTIAVTDPLGNSLPTKVAKATNAKFGAETMTGIIYSTEVLPNTVAGIGTMEIQGKAIVDDEQTDVIWTRNIVIDPTNKTDTSVVFFDLPYIDVTPEIYTVPQYPIGSYVLSSGSFNSTAVFPRHNDNGDYQTEFNKTVYKITRQGGDPFSSSMDGEKIRLKNVSVQIFTYTNNSIGSQTYSGLLNTDLVGYISRVENNSSLLLNIPFRTVADLITMTNQDSEYGKNNLMSLHGYTAGNDPTKQTQYYKKNFYALSLSSGEYEIIHKSLPTTIPNSTKKKPVVNVEFRNIRTLGGIISSYKIFGRSLNTPQSRTLLSEGRLDANEVIVSTNFNNGYRNSPGNFYDQAYLSRFWLTGSFTFSHNSSVLVDGVYISHPGNTAQSDYAILKDDSIEPGRTAAYVSPNLVPTSYWYGKSAVFNNTVEYPSSSFVDALASPIFSPYVASQENLLNGSIHNSNPIKLVGNCLYNFSMRARGGASNTNSSVLYVYFISDTEVTKIATIDSSFRFGANELYTNSFFIGSTKYGTIKIVPVTGEWYLSQLSIKPYQSNAFSPDYFAVKVPVNNIVSNELFEIEAELFDANGKICYGVDSPAFAHNLTLLPLKKQVFIDPNGVTIT